MQQSASFSENEAIWQGLPDLSWRLNVEAKPGADILAYAEPIAEPVAPEAFDVRHAVARLDAELRRRSRHALISAQSYGRGKVLALAFDQTWRWRYRVGDTYHHRFWGQVLRWGAGDKLRAGSDALRIGTDKLIYAPGEPVRVQARVLNDDFSAVADARLRAQVTCVDGAQAGHSLPLTYRVDSNGIYEALVPPLAEAGRYRLEVVRSDRGRDDRVETGFLMVAARRPLEQGEVAATRETLDPLARLTQGRVVGPHRAGELIEAFGPGSRVVRERIERPLWDRPWTFLVLAGLLAAEWIVRKKEGLA
jgi:hypothetical protein